MAKCNFGERSMSFVAREAGCPLDHCPAGHHVQERAEDCPQCISEGRCRCCGEQHPAEVGCDDDTLISDADHGIYGEP